MLGSPDRDQVVAETRAVAARHLVPLARAGVPGRINRPLVRALGAHGLLPRLFPSAVGGARPADVSGVELCWLREALAQECTEAETALALQGLGSYPILQAGRPEVIEAWLPAVCRGEAIAAFALTEPDAGSDAAHLALRASPARGGWMLSGEKVWISNAPDADIYTVFARTTEGAAARGVSAFAVPGSSDGLSGATVDLLSPHPIGRLRFDDVFVPESNLLGEVDRGFRVAMRTLDLFRPSVGALAVGLAQAALDAAIAHAATRRAFGGRLCDLQAVAHKLADMALDVHAARLLVDDAAAAYDAGAPDRSVRAAMAKLFATEMAQRVVDAAVQLHGASGLERGHVIEHLYREVRAPRIYEGASEVQREIIARTVVPRPVG